MTRWDDETYTTAANAEDLKPLSLEEMAKLLDQFKPPPRREFEHDGMIHAIYENGVMRMSAEWMQMLKKRYSAPVEGNAMSVFTGTPVVVDPTLPRPAPALTRFPIVMNLDI